MSKKRVVEEHKKREMERKEREMQERMKQAFIKAWKTVSRTEEQFIDGLTKVDGSAKIQRYRSQIRR